MHTRGLRGVTTLTAMAVLALPGNPQQTAIFTSTDGAFQFSYPSDFEVCTAGKLKPCIDESYIPVCEADAIVCVTYPVKQFEGSNFGAASFQVREIHYGLETMTPDGCATPHPLEEPAGVPSHPEFLISAQHPAEIIGGVLFVHGINGDAAMGHASSVDLYRAFHQKRCFELSLTETETTAEADPPMKTLTDAQQKDVDGSLAQILHSFRFLK
jgi:hypothetical protein